MQPPFAPSSPVATPSAVPTDPAKHSAAHKLFHYRYACVTAQMNLYSKEYLAISGMPTSGDKEADRAMATAQVRAWLTPAAMAIFLSQGNDFRLIEAKDSVAIYEALYEHLNDWKLHLQRELNPQNVPMEDLEKFDALAAEMYKIARGFMALKQLPNGIFNRNRSVMRGMRKHHEEPEAAANGLRLKEQHTPIVSSLRQETQEPAVNTRRIKPWLDPKPRS